MALDSGSLKCLKYLMFFFNLLFFICGIAALTVGIWAVVNADSFRQVLVDNQLIFNGVYIIIAVGAALFLMGFLGCCGAIKENRCLLGTFFVIVLILFIAEVVGGILVFVYYPQVETAAMESQSKYSGSGTDDELVKQGWDTFQATVECCGFNSYKEWANNTVWRAANPSNMTVPSSCCKRTILSESSEPLDVGKCQLGDTEFLNTEGCNTKLRGYLWVVGGVGLGILLFELLGMIFACCLYRAIEED